MKFGLLLSLGLVAGQDYRFANLHVHPSPTNPAIPPSFAVQSPLSNPSYPPSAWFDINNVTTIALLAQATVQRMQTWYTAGQYEWTAWWQIPVLGMAYADLDIALGNQGNKFLVTDLLVKNAGQGYMIDKYIDDQSTYSHFICST